MKKEKETPSPKEEFERLLKDEVKSTRASWTEFRRAWKKDRRFYGWGRDDREREKMFREYLKELSESVSVLSQKIQYSSQFTEKRAAAEKAEADFFALLKEQVFITEGITWKEVFLSSVSYLLFRIHVYQVKNTREIYKDPRYDAVGSSSLREELFNTFLKGTAPHTTTENSHTAATKGVKVVTLDREERRNKAVKEREQKINAERRRLDADIEKSKQGIDKEEGERTFV